MQLHHWFGFGKYKGLTLQQVYQGTNHLDNNLVEAFLKFKVDADAAIITLNHTFFKIDEIGNAVIKIEPYDEDLKGDWSKSIESTFSEGRGIENFLRGNTTLDEFYTKHYRQSNKTVLAGGNPGYVDYIIKNFKNFWFSDDILKKLMSLDVYRFAGIKVTYIGNNTYEYFPYIIIERHTFSKALLDINLKKSYSVDDLATNNDALDYDNQKKNYDRSENARNSFDAMTDGQIDSYDDWYN